MPEKGLFLENHWKIVKKRGKTDKNGFWAFKSQNFEKVYKIKIKNHAIFIICFNRFLTSNEVSEELKKLSESLKP